MKASLTLKFTSAVFIATLAGAAFAQDTQNSGAVQEHQGTQVEGLQSLDTDHDGYISQEEAMNNQDLVNRWGELDTNADGQLDEEEFARFESEGMTEEEPTEQTQ